MLEREAVAAYFNLRCLPPPNSEVARHAHELAQAVKAHRAIFDARNEGILQGRVLVVDPRVAREERLREEKLRKLPSPKVGDKQKPVEFVKVIGKIALYGKQDFECADGESPNLETFSAFGTFDTNALDVSKSLVVIGPLEPVGMPMGKRESHKLAHCVFLFL